MLNKCQKNCKIVYANVKADIKQQDITELVAVSYNIL